MSDSNCKYCPGEPAAYYCENCAIGFCINCVPEDNRRLAPRCTLCRKHLTSFNSHNIVPAFWTQWLRFLKLPLTSGIWVTILVYSFVGLLLPEEGFRSVLISGIYFGIILMMLFELASLLSDGRSSVPTLAEIWSKGEPFLMVRLLLQVVIAALIIFGVSNNLGQWVAMMLLILYGIGFPASVLILALEKRFFSAINPLRILYIITAIGLPYLWLYTSWLAVTGLTYYLYVQQTEQHFLFTLIAFFISFYFWACWFACLGYTAFQYHHQLGLAVASRHKHQKNHQANNKSNRKTQNKMAKSAAVLEADILCAEGRIEDALNLLHTAMSEPMAEMDVYRKYLQLLVQNNDIKRLTFVSKRLVRQFIHQDKTVEAVHIAVIVMDAVDDWCPELSNDAYIVAKGLIKVGRREHALLILEQLIVNNEQDEQKIYYLFDAARLLAEFFNQDAKAIAYLQNCLNIYPEHSLLSEIKSYLEVLITSQSDIQSDALLIDENK